MWIGLTRCFHLFPLLKTGEMLGSAVKAAIR
jgi:hypothetical protein